MHISGGVKRVLILRCGALGDLVYATGAIDALRREYGESVSIDIICTPGTAKLFEQDPRVHHIFPLRHKRFPIWLSAQKRAVIRHAKADPYDLFISLEFGKAFQSLIDAIPAKHKTGMGILSTEITEPDVNRGEALKRYYRDVITPENLSAAKPIVYGVTRQALRSKFPSLPENAIVLAPSNSHNQKKGLNYRAWPFAHWRRLMEKLSDHPLIIVGAKGEEAFFDHLKPYGEHVTDMVGMFSIPELVSVVENARALVCTDSATGHIGAATDTPTFVLMGPNDPRRDSPYRSETNAVYPLSLGLPCSPCYKTERMKQCLDNICMSQMTPAYVVDQLRISKII